jgi:hypothetical protein
VKVVVVTVAVGGEGIFLSEAEMDGARAWRLGGMVA